MIKRWHRLVGGLCVLLALGCSRSPGESIIWATGYQDPAGPPAGRLLSDNAGYWGDCVLTGVEYAYESNPQNPSDRLKDDANTFGRRLLDGQIAGNWHVPIGQTGGPIVVVFDFKRPCIFTEIDLISARTPRLGIAVEARGESAAPWHTVVERPLARASDNPVIRLPIVKTAGRYLRLTMTAGNLTHLDEVLVWGSGEVSARYPEAIAPVYPAELPGSLASIPGMAATRFSPAQCLAWRKTLGPLAARPAIWSILPKDWQARPTPILPASPAVNARLSLVLARNETESALIALTNPSATQSVTVTVGDITLRRAGKTALEPRLVARLLAGGAVTVSKTRDVQVLPFIERGQMPGRSLMRRYLANGAAIADFPRLILPPGGSVLCMLRITTLDAPPGRYTGELTLAGHRGMPLSIDVADVTLPDCRLWITGWCSGTSQFPFETETCRLNDVRTACRAGITVFHGYPGPGSKAALARRFGARYFQTSILPWKYLNGGWTATLAPEQLIADDEADIARATHELVRHMQAAGLDYDGWYAELWDEPGVPNAALFGALARLIKRADPRVRIYMNPCFWTDRGFNPETDIVGALQSYYNDAINISVPSIFLIGDNEMTKTLWTAPRDVRAMYVHPAGRGGREMAWKAFQYGMNGWAYYAYYTPYGNPWDISTWTALNYAYQMVFPGPNGPIIMPLYETMRDGWEDYRLLTALKQHGMTATLDGLLAGYRAGVPVSALRLRALDGFRRASTARE